MKVVKSHQVKRDIMKYAFFERNHSAVVTEGLNRADVLSINKDKLAVEFEIKISKSDLDKELAAIEYSLRRDAGEEMVLNKGTEQATLNIDLESLRKKSGGGQKVSKHEEYVNPAKYFEDRKGFFGGDRYVPNYFYLVVPKLLSDYAADNLKDTKYGVISYDGCRQQGRHCAWWKDGDWFNRDGRPDDAEWRCDAPCGVIGDDRCYEEVTVNKKARKIHTDQIGDDVLMSILQRACTENIVMLEKLTAEEE